MRTPGSWPEGPERAGTRGHEGAGTRGREGAGTRGREGAGFQGPEGAGTRGRDGEGFQGREGAARAQARRVVMAWRRRWVAATALAGAVALVGGCGSTTTAGTSTTAATPAAIPRQLLAEARPIGRGATFQPPATGPVIGRCRRRLGRRYGVHVEVFGANRVVIVPAGIGIRPPIRVSAGRIYSASCYGSLVTLEPTGLALVRPGSRLSLADLFRAWGEPLSAQRLASFKAPSGSRVSVFVDGQSWSGAPGEVRLSRHAEIVLEVGPHVPPHPSYTFPPGT
jgi:hypothetical protein